jgi:hypothetical protein
MNDIVKFAVPELPDIQALGAAMQTQVSQEPPRPSGQPILRLLKSGDWVYGPDSVDVETGSEWALNPLSVHHGYVSWLDSKVEGEVMVPYGRPMPYLAELGPAPGDPWQKQIGALLVCLTGEDEGVEVIYKGTSLGLLDAYAALIPQIAARMAAGDPAFVPVVTLGVDSYKHKKWGTVYKPDIQIVRWARMDGEPEAAGQLEADEPPFDADPEPATPRRRRRSAA